MIEAVGLSKRYGTTVAVDDLSFTVPPGQVTGFVGPNGAGKSTTMRMILGLDAPTRVGGFSHGMCQRLGIAAALLGDPQILILDEPVNGLDPEGVLWIRTLVKSLAAEGRTVFLSSHLMSEMAITADRLVIIGRGHLIAQTTVEELLRSGSGSFVQVRSPQGDQLAALLETRGIAVTRQPDGSLHVAGTTPDVVGEVARLNGLTLQELSAQQASLEQRYMELTGESVDYRTAAGVLVHGSKGN